METNQRYLKQAESPAIPLCVLTLADLHKTLKLPPFPSVYFRSMILLLCLGRALTAAVMLQNEQTTRICCFFFYKNTDVSPFLVSYCTFILTNGIPREITQTV